MGRKWYLNDLTRIQRAIQKVQVHQKSAEIEAHKKFKVQTEQANRKRMLTYFNSVFPEQNFTRITNNNLKKFLKMRKEAGAKVKFSGSKAALLAAVEEDAVKNFQEARNLSPLKNPNQIKNQIGSQINQKLN